MERSVCPVEMICVCGTGGEIRPLRFRMTTGEQELMRVDIDEILSRQEIHYIGAEACIFLCRVTMWGRSRRIELKYSIRSHSWSLLRAVD